MDTFTPLTLLPFETYRTPRPDGRGFQRSEIELSPSIGHFFFSERFRGYDDNTRIAILGYPAAGAARKLVHRSEPSPAWVARQEQIIRCGLWKQFLNKPSLPEQILAGKVALRDGQALGKGWELRHQGNERWATLVRSTATRFVSRENAMSLLATGGSDLHNPFLFSSRLDVLLSNRLPDQMVIACRQGIDALAEFWSIERMIPVVHRPVRVSTKTAIQPALIDELTVIASHAIIFSKENEALTKSLLESLKKRSVPTRLVRLDQQGKPVPKAAATGRR